MLLGAKTSSLTQGYLSKKFPLTTEDEMILINGSVIPTRELVEKIRVLAINESLVDGDMTLAQRIEATDLEVAFNNGEEKFNKTTFEKPFEKINFPWDIFSKNADAISNDFKMLTEGKKSQKLEPSNIKIGRGEIFIETGATIRGAIFNTDNGPVYIGKDAEVMEGSTIRGPFALCDNATIKMGAKIYGATTIGPHCKVGGELNNVMIFGYSNKAHDGFLGNSVIGEWCNLGADTNSSNLKNTYEQVKVWSYVKERFVKTGLQFCGLIMGDHSKCGINTMFNTGTVVGVSANIYGPGFQRNFIKSFSWGGTQGYTKYNLNKAIEVAGIVYGRRNMEFAQSDVEIFRHLHQISIEKNI